MGLKLYRDDNFEVVKSYLGSQSYEKSYPGNGARFQTAWSRESDYDNDACGPTHKHLVSRSFLKSMLPGATCLTESTLSRRQHTPSSQACTSNQERNTSLA